MCSNYFVQTLHMHVCVREGVCTGVRNYITECMCMLVHCACWTCSITYTHISSHEAPDTRPSQICPPKLHPSPSRSPCLESTPLSLTPPYTRHGHYSFWTLESFRPKPTRYNADILLLLLNITIKLISYKYTTYNLVINVKMTHNIHNTNFHTLNRFAVYQMLRYWTLYSSP